MKKNTWERFALISTIVEFSSYIGVVPRSLWPFPQRGQWAPAAAELLFGGTTLHTDTALEPHLRLYCDLLPLSAHCLGEIGSVYLLPRQS